MRTGILASTGLLLLCAVAVQAQQWGPYYGYSANNYTGATGYVPGQTGYGAYSGAYSGWGYPGYYYRPGYGYYGNYSQPNYSPYMYSPDGYGSSVRQTSCPCDGSAAAPAAEPGAAEAAAAPAPACAAPCAPEATVTETPCKPPEHSCCEPFCLFPGLEKSRAGDFGWLSADYIAGVTKQAPAKPLITTGSPADAFPGAIGQPSTAVVVGNQPFDFSFFNGFQASMGYFLDCDDHCAVELAGFYLLPRTLVQGVSSDNNGQPLVARPFYDTLLGTQNAAIIATPSFFNLALVEEFGFPIVPVVGSSVVTTSESLWGAELNILSQGCSNSCFRWRIFAGGRYVQLDEDLSVTDTRTQPVNYPFVFEYLGTTLSPGAMLSDTDDFRTSNHFAGGQVGAKGGFSVGCGWLDFWAKCALGGNNQDVVISGSTTVSNDAVLGTQTTQGGILALPSNIGYHQLTVFSVVSEAGVNTGLDLNKWVRIQLGYSFLYWTNVVRPGDQIDFHVNQSMIPSSPTYPGIPGSMGPGLNRPLFSFQESDYFVHNLTAGLEFHY